MKFSELWAAMILKNAKLLNKKATVTITVEQFRSALEQSFDAGVSESIGDMPSQPSFMDGLFGKRGGK